MTSQNDINRRREQKDYHTRKRAMHSFNPSVSWINTEVGYSINHRPKTEKSAVMQIFDLGMNRRGWG